MRLCSGHEGKLVIATVRFKRGSHEGLFRDGRRGQLKADCLELLRHFGPDNIQLSPRVAGPCAGRQQSNLRHGQRGYSKKLQIKVRVEIGTDGWGRD